MTHTQPPSTASASRPAAVNILRLTPSRRQHPPPHAQPPLLSTSRRVAAALLVAGRNCRTTSPPVALPRYSPLLLAGVSGGQGDSNCRFENEELPAKGTDNVKEDVSSKTGAFDVNKLQKLRSKGGKKTDTVVKKGKANLEKADLELPLKALKDMRMTKNVADPELEAIRQRRMQELMAQMSTIDEGASVLCSLLLSYFLFLFSPSCTSQVAKMFFPRLEIGYEDHRVRIHFGDGPAEELFKRPCCKLPPYIEGFIWTLLKALLQSRHIFKGSVNYAWTSIPTYPRHAAFLNFDQLSIPACEKDILTV
nr:signal recognition particle receptor subunit alpha-like [Ipomoea batatas]